MAQDLSELFEKMSQNDPWLLRQIGREAGLPVWKKRKDSAKTQSEKLLWDKVIKIEKLCIKAAKEHNQTDWDFYESQGKEITAQLKLVQSMS